MSSNANPLNIEELFMQLNKDLKTHLSGSGSGKAALTLRINSYSRLIAAHPENTHDSRKASILSTEELMKKIDESINKISFSASSTQELLVEAYTRIIVGRSQQRNVLDH
jgi:hypothetical protein